MADVSNGFDITFRLHAQQLRATWQARALAYAEGKTAAVLLSVLAHNWDEAMPVLLRAVFPGFTSIGTPFLCSAGKIMRNGGVYADIVTGDAQIVSMHPLYDSERDLEKDFRELADALKLDDTERVEMFDAIKRWIVCDFRLDPNFDPADPDAKRLLN